MSKSSTSVGAGAPRVSSGPGSSGAPKAGGLRKRRVTPSAGASRTASSSGAGILRFYTEDSPGLKIQPTVVLVMSLLFIAFVILLHLWGKFNR